MKSNILEITSTKLDVVYVFNPEQSLGEKHKLSIKGRTNSILSTKSFALVSDLSSWNNALALLFISLCLNKENGPIPDLISRPRKTLAAAVKLSQSARSW